jgi:hypothetical protein
MVAPTPATAVAAASSLSEPAGHFPLFQDDDQQPAEKIEAVEARLVSSFAPCSTLPHTG